MIDIYQFIILREEYQLHEQQIDLICSTLSERTDEESKRAQSCLTKIKADIYKPFLE